jgi:hypothetical protein
MSFSSPPPHFSRPITPVSTRIDHEGAPRLALSPNAGTKNLKILYEVVKRLDDKQQLGADFDQNGQPYVFLGKSGRVDSGDVVKAANAVAAREELANILNLSAQVLSHMPADSMQARHAAFDLKMVVHSASIAGGFTAGALKAPLRAIAHSLRHLEHEALAGKYRFGRATPESKSTLQLQSFTLLQPVELEQLATLACKGMQGDNEQIRNGMQVAVNGMVALVQSYRSTKSFSQRVSNTLAGATASSSIDRLIRQSPDFNRLLVFAKQWRKLMRQKDSELYFHFGHAFWAQQISQIAQRIVRESHRSARVLPVPGVNEGALLTSTQALRRGQSQLQPSSAPLSISPLANDQATRASWSSTEVISDSEISSSEPVFAYQAVVDSETSEVYGEYEVLYERSDIWVGESETDLASDSEPEQDSAAS